MSLAARKAKDSVSLAVLRHLKIAVTNLSVELNRDINDGELVGVMQKQADSVQIPLNASFLTGGKIWPPKRPALWSEKSWHSVIFLSCY